MSIESPEKIAEQLSKKAVYHRGIPGCWDYPQLRGAVMPKYNLAGESLLHADFSCAKLMGANFSNADLHEANFSNADLRDAILTGAKCGDSPFEERKPATFAGAKLQRANFAGANLSGVNFAGADFEGAILTNANLNGADFTGANHPQLAILTAGGHTAYIQQDTLQVSWGVYNYGIEIRDWERWEKMGSNPSQHFPHWREREWIEKYWPTILTMRGAL